jgi:hypothetical protein
MKEHKLSKLRELNLDNIIEAELEGLHKFLINKDSENNTSRNVLDLKAHT